MPQHLWPADPSFSNLGSGEPDNDYFRDARCRRCKLSPSLCFCDRIIPVQFPVRILIVQHFTERKSISNTGSLLPLLLDNAEVLPYAHPADPFDPTPLRDSEQEYRLLYPHPDAEELSPTTFAESDAPPTLVVLDGTWPKAQRMTRRVSDLHRLPSVCLPSDPILPDASEAHAQSLVNGCRGFLRRRHLPGRLSTLESVLQALAAPGHRNERLEKYSAELLRRRLHLMGRISRENLELGMGPQI